jgi:acyl-CoA hydrolase
MPRTISAKQLLDEFSPGRCAYIPGANGELHLLQALFAEAPEVLSGVTLVSCLLPGLNRFDYAALDLGCRLETFMLPPPLRPSFMAGRTLVFPLSYSAIGARLAERQIDVAFLHVTQAQAGACTFGVAADFGPIVSRTARRRIGILNHAMPRPTHSPSIPLHGFDAIVELDEPLPAAKATPDSPELRAIARHVAALVPDGATLQIGIGQAPDAVWRALGGHKGLTLWSGIVTDGFFAALDAGAMASVGHVAGIAYGNTASYGRLDRSAAVAFKDVETTHAASALGQLDRFTAINSALEVDLFGQANLEWQAGRLSSGVGGAPDFNAAARRSPGGRSIVAMPATARDGTISRISARLNTPTVSLGRAELDTVVTEHGAASLAGLSMEARAQALIAVAAPQYRQELERAWSEQRKKL